MPPNVWYSLASDLFYLNKQNYTVMVDYLPKYPVVRKMPNITSTALVYVMRETFAEWGPQHTIKTDN